MHQELISVIIPVYNAEDCVERCLQSVVQQTYSKLEIIVVDDGSTDSSGVICDMWAKRDSRIAVLHQKNQGVATARKNGILAGEGEYVCFVDADDSISPDMIQFMAEHIGKSDLITTGSRRMQADGTQICRYDAFREGVYETEEEMDYILSNMIIFEGKAQDGILPFLGIKMFRMELLRRALETVDLSLFYAEDRDLLFRYILLCRSICITHELFYNYCYREGSAVQSMNPQILSNLNALYHSLQKAFVGHAKQDVLMLQLQKFIVSRLCWVPMWLGFSKEAQMFSYVMPVGQDFLFGKKIVLYGAGKVGIDYYTQICAGNRGVLVGWVDKNPQNSMLFPIKPKENLLAWDYDIVIIAVEKEAVAEEIRKELIADGVAEEKIVWDAPVKIL